MTSRAADPPRRRARLAVHLMAAQAVVLVVGALALLVTASLVAPGLFHDHLARSGVQSALVSMHAEEAFRSSFAIGLSVGGVVSLVAAGMASLFLVRRVTRPVEALAEAAEQVAAGRYTVEPLEETFSAELDALSASFTRMAGRLADTEATRTGLLADLAHELRTPLATLEAYIDGIEDGVVASDADAFQTMRSQVDRLRRLAGDLRESAAAEEHALGMSPVGLDARDAAFAAAAAARPAFGAKGVSLELALPPGRAAVCADSVRLQQVLANLLDNALRHTPAGGRVGLTVAVGSSGRVSLDVVDDGEGIPPDQLDAVFDRFHRVDPARSSSDGSGSGLGLTIARAIVVDHGGTLTADSAGAGTGSRFTVRLPAGGDQVGRRA